MSGENQELRKAGLKVTLPRVKIMQILESAKDRHLSAEERERFRSRMRDRCGVTPEPAENTPQ